MLQRTLVGLMLCLVVFSGCNGLGTNSSPKIDLTKLPTDEEVKEFAVKYVEAMGKGDATAAALTDWDALLQITTADVDVPENFKTGFSMGVKDSTTHRAASKYVELIEAGGFLELLRIREVNNEKRALFRLATLDHGVIYEELLLYKDKSGKVRIYDAYVYSSGEKQSETLRRLLIIGANSQPTLTDQMLNRKNEVAKHLGSSMRNLTRYVQGGNGQAALDVYKQLPQSLKQEKTFLLLRMHAAAMVSEREYAGAINDLRRYFPNDPSADVAAIDHYLLQGNYQEALNSIDRFDKSIGGDPYLNIMRAETELQMGDYAAAEQHANQAVQDYPHRPDPYWVLASLAAAKQDFDQVTRRLIQLHDNFEIDWNQVDLVQDPQMLAYIRSPAHQRWLNHRRNKGN